MRSACQQPRPSHEALPTHLDAAARLWVKLAQRLLPRRSLKQARLLQIRHDGCVLGLRDEGFHLAQAREVVLGVELALQLGRLREEKPEKRHKL